MLELTLLTVVIVDVIEEIGIEIGPFLEGILLTEQTWCHVSCDKRCLDEQGTAATHRIDKVGIALPTRHEDHSCCQYLVQRSLYTFLAIAATVQRLTAGVKAQRALILGDVYVQTDIGIGYGDIRTFARRLAELIYNGIFYLI